MALMAKCKGVGVARRIPIIGAGEQQVDLLEELVAEVVSENLDGEESLEWKKSLGYVDLNLMSCLSVCTRSSYSYSDGLGGVDHARAAVRFFWKLEYPDEDSPTDSFRVSSVVKGIKRRFAKPVEQEEAFESG